MVSRNFKRTIDRAKKYASDRKHGVVTLEHLLLALTEDRDAIPVLKDGCDDFERLKNIVRTYLDKELQHLVKDGSGLDIKPTKSFQRVQRRAALYTARILRRFRSNTIESYYVVPALFPEGGSYASHLLRMQGMTYFDVFSFIEMGITRTVREQARAHVMGTEMPDEESSNLLQNFGEAMNELAKHWPKREVRAAVRVFLTQLGNES